MNWIYLQLPHQIVFCPSFFTSLKQSPKWTVFWIIQCEYGEMSSWPLDIKNWRFWLATAWFSSLSFFRDPIDTAELLNRALPPSVSQWGYQRGEERGRERESEKKEEEEEEREGWRERTLIFFSVFRCEWLCEEVCPDLLIWCYGFRVHRHCLITKKL